MLGCAVSSRYKISNIGATEYWSDGLKMISPILLYCDAPVRLLGTQKVLSPLKARTRGRHPHE
jgi:hypothetical protein